MGWASASICQQLSAMKLPYLGEGQVVHRVAAEHVRHAFEPPENRPSPLEPLATAVATTAATAIAVTAGPIHASSAVGFPGV